VKERQLTPFGALRRSSRILRERREFGAVVQTAADVQRGTSWAKAPPHPLYLSNSATAASATHLPRRVRSTDSPSSLAIPLSRRSASPGGARLSRYETGR